MEALKYLSTKEQNKLLDEISKKDPKAAEELRNHLFQFSDLSQCNGKGIQSLLNQTELEDWALALRQKNDDLLSHLKRNMSERRYNSLVERINEMGPKPMSKVTDAQNKIMAVASELKEKGLLMLLDDGDDPLV